jgi:geranylgeranyl diphosphate synthase type II
MQTLSQVREVVEHHLTTCLSDRKPSNLYEPARYVLTLGGKRVRPLLLAASHLLWERELPARALHACTAVEMFHNFTLVHDDIMDEAPLRRGQPTVHQHWNVATAILSGDVMLIEVYRLLEQACFDGQLRSVLQVFNRTATLVCEGQQMDMDFERRQDVGWQDYLEMIRGKTACLLGASMQIGALTANASADEGAHLYNIGETLGMAFQLKDDLLDTFGSQRIGKQKGGDIQRNKKTALYTAAFHHGTLAQREELVELYSGNTRLNESDRIARVTALFEESGARHAVEAHVHSYEGAGQKLLAQLNGHKEGQAMLTSLLDMLRHRVS